ncbi:MAG: TonB-dependent receptor [Gammaproteobacteria bacterium]
MNRIPGIVGCCVAAALGTAQAAGIPGRAERRIEEITVRAQRGELVGAVASASEGVFAAEQLEHRPVLRSGELMEVVPGLVVTQHSGDGKANQYFLRGFNLDHGTDLAVRVDGMPVNLPTHAHGQGYSDVNFVIPELIAGIAYRKGTYCADEGNFSAAGAVEFHLRDSLDGARMSATGGQDDYRRIALAGGAQAAGGNWVYGAEYTGTEGPWELGEDLRKLNAMLRFGRGGGDDRWSITAMGYDARWTATDQIPRRAVDAGTIDRFGFVDPTDGGRSHRYSLSAAGSRPLGAGVLDWSAYGIDYRLDLFSNFTYFTDPVDGDQFEQFDARRIYGGALGWRRDAVAFGVPATLRAGLQIRHDAIDTVGLYRTRARQRLSTVREDTVAQTGYGLWGEQTLRINDWSRLTLGLRADVYDFEVESDLGANSGARADVIVSPKAALVFGPFHSTEVFLNAGRGFHANDARGTTIVVDPVDGVTPAARVDPLVSAVGAEIGVRTALVPKLQLAASLWMLDLDSELVFVGDGGTTEASRATRRVGVEVAAYWRPVDWLVLDADLAWSRSRFTQADPAGDRIPNAVPFVASAGASFEHPSGWSAGARLRHFAAAPLIEDGSRESEATTVVNLEGGYRFAGRWRATLAMFNVFDSRDADITYFYGSQLAGEPAPVDDIHFHPIEPRTLRVTLEARF